MTVELAPSPVFKAFDNNGNPLANGQLFTYVAGTSTPQATYVDSTQTTPNTNPVILNARGEANVWLDISLTYKLQLQDSFGNQIWTVDQIPGGYLTAALLATILTQSYIGAILYPQTAAELAAGVTIVNFAYPPLIPERYGNNTTPGTTDMTAAIQSAVNVAKLSGGTVQFGTTHPYFVTAPINCTFAGSGTQTSYVIRGIIGNDQPYTVVAQHSGVAIFDCTGNDNIVFEDLTIGTAIPTANPYPQTGILAARNNTGGSINNVQLVRVKIIGYFSIACYYNYGAEGDITLGCYFLNANPNGGIATRIYTANNVNALVSVVPGLIATGTQSCLLHEDIACQDVLMQASVLPIAYAGGASAITTRSVVTSSVTRLVPGSISTRASPLVTTVALSASLSRSCRQFRSLGSCGERQHLLG